MPPIIRDKEEGQGKEDKEEEEEDREEDNREGEEEEEGEVEEIEDLIELQSSYISIGVLLLLRRRSNIVPLVGRSPY